MYTGPGNLNASTHVEKMTIVNLETDEEIIVLYNPQSYTCKRSVNYAPRPAMGTDGPVMQFESGSGEVLSFELFFDSLFAADEVGGSQDDRKKFLKNSRKISLDNSIDVRDYTRKIYDLTKVDADAHCPPKLQVEWASLQFVGYLSSCEEHFTKFDENGLPVRAVLNCTFIEFIDPDSVALNPRQSPDTTKYRKVRQGDSLWAFSAREYGGAGQWRQIAQANGIDNPRRLRSGETLVLPALKD